MLMRRRLDIMDEKLNGLADDANVVITSCGERKRERRA
jgi:hypothetical protein